MGSDSDDGVLDSIRDSMRSRFGLSEACCDVQVQDQPPLDEDDEDSPGDGVTTDTD